MQHGRKFELLPEHLKLLQTQKEQRVLKDYIEKYHELQSLELTDSKYLESSESVLRINPENYTVWNSRRLCLNEIKSVEVLERDLQLTVDLIKLYPKSYWLFNHRRWILVSLNSAKFFEEELKLCSKMLEKDDRNFHAWDHRRWCIEKMKTVSVLTDDSKELKYSFDRISKNFSNYSAWHYRSMVLTRMGKLDPGTLNGEIELVKNALFTEPADQSPWLYYFWVLETLMFDKLIKVLRCKNRIIFVFTSPVIPLSSDIILDGKKKSVTWQDSKRYSKIWTCFLPTTVDDADTEDLLIELPENSFKTLSSTINKKISLSNAKDLSFIQKEIKDVLQLYELEPNSKNCLLFLAKASCWLDNYEQSENYYVNLSKVDPFRKNFYAKCIGELKSLMKLNKVIEKKEEVLDLNEFDIDTLEFILTRIPSTNSFTEIIFPKRLAIVDENLLKIFSIDNIRKINFASCLKSLDILKYFSNTQVESIAFDNSIDTTGICWVYPTLKFINNSIVSFTKEQIWMSLALRESLCCSRTDSAYSVGCVVVSNVTQQILSKGYSRQTSNCHAEQIALSKLSGLNVPEISIFSTMIPCHRRLSGATSCVELISNLSSKIKINVFYSINEPSKFIKDNTGEILKAQVDTLIKLNDVNIEKQTNNLQQLQ